MDETRLRVPKPSAARVGRDAAGHALEPEDVLHQERQVEADEREHEVASAEPSFSMRPGELREPVVEAAKTPNTEPPNST